MDNCFNSSNSYATVGLSYTVIHLFPKISSLTQWLFTMNKTFGWAWACFFVVFRKLNKVLPPFCAFNLWRISAGFISFLLGNWWNSTVPHWEWQGLTPSCMSSNAQKQDAWPLATQRVQYCHQLSIKEFYFLRASVFRENVKFRLTLNHRHTSFAMYSMFTVSFMNISWKTIIS